MGYYRADFRAIPVRHYLHRQRGDLQVNELFPGDAQRRIKAAIVIARASGTG
jgi:hypothetical protein